MEQVAPITVTLLVNNVDHNNASTKNKKSKVAEIIFQRQYSSMGAKHCVQCTVLLQWCPHL